MKLRVPGRSGPGTTLRWWGWAIVAGLVLGVLAGVAGYQKVAGAPYVSSAQVLVTGRFSDSQVDSALSAEQYVDQRMSTYAAVATSEQVTGPAARVLHSDPDSVAQRITATIEGDTTVITLAVQGDSPGAAITGAAAVTRAFTAAVTQLETVGGGTSSRVALNVISNPTTPPDRGLPAWPVWILGGVVLLIGLALLAGLLIRWLYPKWQQAQRPAVTETATVAEPVADAVEPEPAVDPVPRQVSRTERARPEKPAARKPGRAAARKPAADDHDRGGPPTVEIPATAPSARRGG